MEKDEEQEERFAKPSHPNNQFKTELEKTLLVP